METFPCGCGINSHTDDCIDRGGYLLDTQKIHGVEKSKHEVVNEILEYLDIRKRELEEDMLHAEADGNSDYAYYEGSYETYSHLIAKLEDDYR